MSPRLSLSDLFLRAQPDERLAAIAAAGHERAFTVLVERHRRALTRYAARVIGSGREEDIVQQALVLAWKALGNGTQVQRVEPWLYRIVHNVAVREAVRAAPRTEPLDEKMAELRCAPELEQRLEAREVLRGLATLPERQRLALLGTELEGRSRRQLASELGLSEGAVRQLVHRARAQVRASVAALVPFPVLTRLLGEDSAAGTAGSAAAVPAGLAAASGTVSASGFAVGGLVAKAGVAAVAAGLVGGGLLVHQLGAPPSGHRHGHAVPVASRPQGPGSALLKTATAAQSGGTVTLAALSGRRSSRGKGVAGGTGRQSGPAPAAGSPATFSGRGSRRGDGSGRRQDHGTGSGDSRGGSSSTLGGGDGRSGGGSSGHSGGSDGGAGTVSTTHDGSSSSGSGSGSDSGSGSQLIAASGPMASGSRDGGSDGGTQTSTTGTSSGSGSSGDGSTSGGGTSSDGSSDGGSSDGGSSSGTTTTTSGSTSTSSGSTASSTSGGS